jgi:hypothetical protein
MVYPIVHLCVAALYSFHSHATQSIADHGSVKSKLWLLLTWGDLSYWPEVIWVTDLRWSELLTWGDLSYWLEVIWVTDLRWSELLTWGDLSYWPEVIWDYCWMVVMKEGVHCVCKQHWYRGTEWRDGVAVHVLQQCRGETVWRHAQIYLLLSWDGVCHF